MMRMRWSTSSVVPSTASGPPIIVMKSCVHASKPPESWGRPSTSSKRRPRSRSRCRQRTSMVILQPRPVMEAPPSVPASRPKSASRGSRHSPKVARLRMNGADQRSTSDADRFRTGDLQTLLRAPAVAGRRIHFRVRGDRTGTAGSLQPRRLKADHPAGVSVAGSTSRRPAPGASGPRWPSGRGRRTTRPVLPGCRRSLFDRSRRDEIRSPGRVRLRPASVSGREKRKRISHLHGGEH